MANRKMKAFSKIVAGNDGFCEYMKVSFASVFEAFDEFAFRQRRTGLARLSGFTVDYDFTLDGRCG